jgi:DNA adenine methylase
MAFTQMAGAKWPACRPLVKWSGGKSGELKQIAAAMPPRISSLTEPFFGGGAVTFALPSSIPAYGNDRSQDLASLYRLATARDPLLISAVTAIDAAWNAISGSHANTDDARIAETVGEAAMALPKVIVAQNGAAEASSWTLKLLARKRKFLHKLGEKATDPDAAILSAMKGGLYSALRAAYNRKQDPRLQAALFWFLRDFAFGGMFRKSSSGDFNVPYGGMSYNRRLPGARLNQLDTPAIASRLASLSISEGDFEDFLFRNDPGSDGFVFLDPPYDSRFATYDGVAFTHDDHLRLAAWMERARTRWMIVIAATDFVRDTYCGIPGAEVSEAGKVYASSIKNRYDRKATHLLVTNYDRASGRITRGNTSPRRVLAAA